MFYRFVPALAAVICLAGAEHASAEVRNPHSLRPISADDWDLAAAAHLARRAAFGADPEQLRRLAALSPAAAVRELVDFDHQTAAFADPFIDPLLTRAAPRGDARSRAERQAAARAKRRAQFRSIQEVRLWWLDRLAHSPRPFEERMTLFWHGHFTSGIREVRDAIYLHEQNQLLRNAGLGDFGDLLLKISQDRAMLVYLDGRRNVRANPNENYARELLELFTLGEGHYRESDISAAARAFTGWTFNDNGFVFRARQHDYGLKTFLGERGKFNGDDIIRIILDERQCSMFLATELLTTFVRPDPSRRLVRDTARLIRRHRYELRPVLRTLLISKAFYHPEARGVLIKSPTELLIGTARSLDLAINDLPTAHRALKAMGQELMQPPNVAGWDGGEKWITTSRLFTRYNSVAALLVGNEREPDSEPDADPRVRTTAGHQPPLDVTPWLEKYELTTAAQVVDFFVAHLLARPLTAEKRHVLINYLNGRYADFSSTAPDAAPRVRRMLQLLVSTPEYQLH